VEPDPEDQAKLKDVEEIEVEFCHDGRLITTTTMKDGTLQVEDDERYSIRNEVITITHPDYKRMVMFRMDDGQLRVHSEQFIALLDPVKEKSGS
jgi:hypothetical protein